MLPAGEGRGLAQTPHPGKPACPCGAAGSHAGSTVSTLSPRTPLHSSSHSTGGRANRYLARVARSRDAHSCAALHASRIVAE